MSEGFRITILGCGSSGGVPRLGDDWGACDPANPRNRRLRCSALVERTGPEGVTRVLFDTSPDMRAQLLAAGAATVDAVVYTHGHADHVHGIDDLRQVVHRTRTRLPVWADAATAERLMAGFGYVFSTPRGSDYPPICTLNLIEGPVTVAGAGGPVTVQGIEVQHGSIRALGLRVGEMVYMPDVSEIPDPAWEGLAGTGLFIIDALRHRPHPSHAHLARTLDWIGRLAPARAVLTNMHYDLDHARLSADLPAGVIPAHDGLTLPFAG
ncbi:MAG: MBL fold metallo-hydrolase [Rubellimicrobium sp.]|nr:MBL fold metallo-hydrolase [Rubellimicrobium sp.]